MPDPSDPHDDGLCIPEVGEHSKYKHHFIARYIHAFTTSMKNQKWAGLYYIDLFAGAGIERLRTSRKLDWGSPMLAARSKDPFTRLYLCERDAEKCDALRQRVTQVRPDSHIVQGDAENHAESIVADVPMGGLSLAFLDPYGLHLKLSTLRVLCRRRTDLVIFFPDRMDALRNWAAYYFDNPDSNLDNCLGADVDWRSRLGGCLPEKRGEVLRDLYKSQIQSQLNCPYVDFERIKTIKGAPLYYLIFCSRHQFGLKLWQGTSRKKPNGQSTFSFDDDTGQE